MSNIITTDGGMKIVWIRQGRIARPLSLNADWAHLRVCVRCYIESTSVDYVQTPAWAFGLCSGGTNIMGDPTTDHFVGVLADDATWTRGVSGTTYWVVNPLVAATKVGTTVTKSAALSGSNLYMQGASGNHGLYFLNIIKGSPDYSFSWTYYKTIQSGGWADQDWSAYEMLDHFLTLVSHSNTEASPVTLAVDEAGNGTLDHFCFWWGQERGMGLLSAVVAQIS
jgi:hypothetical protein